MIRQNIDIILASTSPVRKEIMSSSGLDFRVEAPDFDEEEAKIANPGLKIDEMAVFLAKGKALSVSKNFPDALVIGSDQICEIEGRRIDKSHDEGEAFLQLKKLSDKTHFQNNGIVICKNSEVIFEKMTRVELKMREICDEEMHRYVNIDKPWGCAGSYKYESLGKHLFAKIKGDYYSILGLNIQEILTFLHNNKYIGL